MPSLDNRRLRLLMIICVVFGYIAFFGLEYSAGLFGRSPVLDARENLGWVELIRAGQLPEEPLYRALLYPLLLSFFPVSIHNLPSMAIVFGLSCHLLSAYIVGCLARLVWKSTMAAWLSSLLYAIYPVSLYFAVQVLDVTFATTLFLAALLCLIRPSPRPIPSRLLAGFFIGCAVLARPNFLLVALAMPFVALIQSKREGGVQWNAVFVFILPLAMLMLGQGLLNLKLSGDFRLMPWQGSYNLYAANKTGANGKYFVQKLSFEQLPAGVNPTRKESEVLYLEAAGVGDAELDIDAMSTHWKRQLIADIQGDPGRWLGLMVQKSFFILNDWEQYNNLSYAYQKDRYQLLRFNPLGWGVLLLLASCALMSAWMRSDRERLAAIAILGLSYAAGVILFFVSARFRIPLAPLLCIAAGGLVYSSHVLRGKRVYMTLVSLLALAVVAYGNWFGARDTSTYIQDQTLLAISASQQAEDIQALKYVGMVLEQQPQRQDMRRIQVTSHFNLWLEAPDDNARSFHWDRMNEALDALLEHDAATYFVSGVSAWHSGNGDAAAEAWLAGLAEYPHEAENCAAALLAVGKAAPAQPPELIKQVQSLLTRR